MSTTIEWTKAPGRKGETWNPIAAFNVDTGKRGWFCTKPSDGCKVCYAESRNRHIGNGLKYTVGNASKVRVELVNIEKPFSWREPRMVFPCSMTDLFLDLHTDEMIAEIVAVMALTPKHIFQVLTKRPARLRALWTSEQFLAQVQVFVECHALDRTLGHSTPDVRGADWPLPNLWMGVTAEDQPTADERIPELLLTPAALRWISSEPLRSDVDLTPYLEYEGFLGDQPTAALDWVVVGGESGTQARDTVLSYIAGIVDQCAQEDVPCFVKQLGRHPFDDLDGGADGPLTLSDKKGGTIEEWPERLRVRQWPEVASA